MPDLLATLWMGCFVSVIGASHVAPSDYSFPPVEQLPIQKELPDPFLRSDGTRVKSKADWQSQRAYLKEMLMHYMYGHIPPRPRVDQVSVVQTESRKVFDGKAIEEHYTITIGRNGKQTDCRMWLIRPGEKKRYPTIIKNCYTEFHDDTTEKGRLTSQYDFTAARDAVNRGYLLCKFNRRDFADDRPEEDARQTGIYPLFPEYDWGAIAVWAWAHGVVLDVLDQLGYVDTGRTVVTGHSRGGQAAIAAGIFDERFAVVVPCTGGFGSTGVLRIRDPNGVRGTIDYIADVLRKSAPHWHHERYHQFAGQQDRMPFDAHTLVALVAPRPVLNTNAIFDQYNNRLSNEVGIRVGREIYKFWGAEEWCRIHWRPGKHAQREEDWTALLDFADEYFFGKQGASAFNVWQYPHFQLPVSWQAPDSSNAPED